MIKTELKEKEEKALWPSCGYTKSGRNGKDEPGDSNHFLQFINLAYTLPCFHALLYLLQKAVPGPDNAADDKMVKVRCVRHDRRIVTVIR